MLDDETIIFLVVLGIAFVVFVIVLNPFFWQGFRNAKFWDEQKKRKDTSNEDVEPWTDSTC